MAHRRCLQSLARHAPTLICLKRTPPLSTLEVLTPKPSPAITIPKLELSWFTLWSRSRYFSSNKSDDSENEVEMDEVSDGEAEKNEAPSGMGRDYSPKERRRRPRLLGTKWWGRSSVPTGYSKSMSLFSQWFRLDHINLRLAMGIVFSRRG